MARDRKKNYAACKAEGRCYACGKNKRHDGISRCKTCWFKFASRRHFGSASKWRELKSLFYKQEERCCYSGRRLDIGRNASIEHVEPVSKHERGRADLRNIRWVETQINTMKGQQSLHEFLLSCKDVLRFFGYEVNKQDEK